MEPFSAASHHDVLLLVVQIAVLLFAARGLGEIALRLGQPSVIGEILAGIILGPSLLSGFVPLIGDWIVPHTDVQGYLLEVVSLIGAMFLLLITGLETDLTLIRRHARTAIGVSFGGITITFLSGFLLGQFLPDFLLADNSQRLVFSLFIATAMSISAIPVIAKVLMDLNLMRRDIGQTIIAAGMSDDTIGWILLSVVAGIASGEAVTIGSVLQTVGSVLAFMVLSFTAGRWLVKRLLDFVQDEVTSEDRLLTLVVIMMFAWGAITQALNLEAVLGAFVMGILFGQMPRLPESVHHKLESIALAVFSPIFFAVAGLKVNILNLLQPQLLVIALVVIFIASFGKVVGTYAGARIIGGRDHWTALSFGAGLNARGAMEIIIATIGLSLGILTQDMFSIIVLMAMSTSLMAPPALRWVLSHVQPEEQELQRLRQEELSAGSLIANIHRVLLPVRWRAKTHLPVQTIEAHLLEKLGRKSELSVTLLNVSPVGERTKGATFLDKLAEVFGQQKELVKKVVEHTEPVPTILEEAGKDYDLLVLGASETNTASEFLFTPMVDALVRLAPCPTIVVHGPRIPEGWQPHRILVPISGSTATKNAAELGFFLAGDDKDEVYLLHVITNDSNYLDTSGATVERRLRIGHELIGELQELGISRDVTVNPNVRQGKSPEEVILEMAKREKIDLIILGTAVRYGSERIFLGPRVEHILRNAPCPVVIVNS